MFSSYSFETIAQERQREVRLAYIHNLQVRLALSASGRHRRSEILVKLARLLISAGESINARIERDTPEVFPGEFMPSCE